MRMVSGRTSANLAALWRLGTVRFTLSAEETSSKHTTPWIGKVSDGSSNALNMLKRFQSRINLKMYGQASIVPSA